MSFKFVTFGVGLQGSVLEAYDHEVNGHEKSVLPSRATHSNQQNMNDE